MSEAERLRLIKMVKIELCIIKFTTLKCRDRSLKRDDLDELLIKLKKMRVALEEEKPL